MSDQCAACCREYNHHIETERLARADLERRFDAFRREQFVRRETLMRSMHALQDKTAELIKAQTTVEALSASLAEWQRLAENSPQMTLVDAMAELRGITDPLDVEQLEQLPPVAA